MSRVALVTGGSRGIGRAIAIRLGASGHRVAVNFRTDAVAAAAVVSEVVAAGGDGMAVGGDVSDPDDVAGIFEQIAAEWGPVEILVNNAGITRDNLVLRMSPEDWDDVMRVDLRSVYLCSRTALRAMLRARWGRIISVSSVAGIGGNAGQANYAAAKAGVIGFTASLAKEVGSRGITVNAVAPGFIETDMTGSLGDDLRAAARERIALGRFGTPAEVASVVGYLASDEASYVTGQAIVVDGGMAM